MTKMIKRTITFVLSLAVLSGSVTAVLPGEAEGALSSLKDAFDVQKSVSAAGGVSFPAGTDAAEHGALFVRGTDLVDQNGAAFQLHGVSTHGITWFPEYVNYDAFLTLRDDWGANVVRLALYTAEYNGYTSGGNKAALEQVIDNGVSYASQLGMYVIIDWHILSDGNPNTHKEEAKDFFNRMSAKYKDYPNVLYEICNEPNGGVSWNDIKNYANEVIPVIHGNAPDAVVLCGTPTWSQDVEQVAGNLPADTHNVMYTLHFYAATHGDWIRQKVRTAHAAGTPVFVSEFSICDASGNGGIDYDSAAQWFSLIDEYNLSYCGWSLSNKAETSALISSGCQKTAGWSEGELSDTGRYLRNQIRRSLKITPQEAGAMYRLYYPLSGEHLYTADISEGNTLIGRGWRYEGVAWRAPLGGTPVYRLFFPGTGEHHYTADTVERSHLLTVGWSDEGIGWYFAGASGVPVYRLYNPSIHGVGAHHYTTDAYERDVLMQRGWNYEGISWYGNA